MTTGEYLFYELSEDVTGRLGFEPLPFPVRRERAGEVVREDGVALDALLDELERFVREHPEHAGRYARNGAQLALVHATACVERGDFAAALASVSAGLRINPQHAGLRVHQALALQVNGYVEAAAGEYEQLLWDAPVAFDPLVRALAAKAFAASGQREEALAMLEVLPERAFNDPALQALRHSLSTPPPAPATARGPVCPSCGEPVQAAYRFCPACAGPLPVGHAR